LILLRVCIDGALLWYVYRAFLWIHKAYVYIYIYRSVSIDEEFLRIHRAMYILVLFCVCMNGALSRIHKACLVQVFKCIYVGLIHLCLGLVSCMYVGFVCRY